MSETNLCMRGYQSSRAVPRPAPAQRATAWACAPPEASAACKRDVCGRASAWRTKSARARRELHRPNIPSSAGGKPAQGLGAAHSGLEERRPPRERGRCMRKQGAPLGKGKGPRQRRLCSDSKASRPYAYSVGAGTLAAGDTHPRVLRQRHSLASMVRGPGSLDRWIKPSATSRYPAQRVGPGRTSTRPGRGPSMGAPRATSAPRCRAASCAVPSAGEQPAAAGPGRGCGERREECRAAEGAGGQA